MGEGAAGVEDVVDDEHPRAGKGEVGAGELFDDFALRIEVVELERDGGDVPHVEEVAQKAADEDAAARYAQKFVE
jgi:hypothetical protein